MGEYMEEHYRFSIFEALIYVFSFIESLFFSEFPNPFGKSLRHTCREMLVLA